MIAQVANVHIPINTAADVIYIVHVDGSGYPVKTLIQSLSDGEGGYVEVECAYVYAVNIELGEDEGEALVPVRQLVGNLYNHSSNLDALLEHITFDTEYKVHERDTEEVVQQLYSNQEVLERVEQFLAEHPVESPVEEEYYEPYTVEDFVELMNKLKWILMLAAGLIILGVVVYYAFGG